MCVTGKLDTIVKSERGRVNVGLIECSFILSMSRNQGFSWGICVVFS